MSHLSPQPFASVEMRIIAASYCCIFVQGPVFCFLCFVFLFPVRLMRQVVAEIIVVP